MVTGEKQFDGRIVFLTLNYGRQGPRTLLIEPQAVTFKPD